MINVNQATSVDPTALLTTVLTVDDDCSEALAAACENIPDGGILPAPPHDPEAPVKEDDMITTTRKVATVQFEIASRGPFMSFRFQAGRPEALAKNLTEAEWEELRNRFDGLAQQTRWNESAFFILLVAVVTFTFLFLAVVRDGINSTIGNPLLAIWFMLVLYLAFKATTQRRKKEDAMDRIRDACKEYSEKFKKKWIHLEFYESNPDEKFSYHAQLTFHKTIRLIEPERIPYVMDDRYYEDQD